MKNIIYLAVIVLCFSCTPVQKNSISFENTSQEVLVDAGILLKAEVFSTMENFDGAKLPLLKDVQGNLLSSQADDLDGDGNWDEVFVLGDFQAGEVKEVNVSFVEKADYPDLSQRTNIRFARKDQDYKEVTSALRETHAINTKTQKVWQMEGIAWENDRLGFRNYFDQRNGHDIFGKVTEKMVLDKVGYKDEPSYHVYNPEWGVDVLKVGNSLGAGSVAFMYNDSLYRLGDNGTGSCTVLIEGPLRSVFRFEFEGWKMGDQVLDVVHDISIQAGKYCFENKVSYTGSTEDIKLVTGIVNKKCDHLYETGENSTFLGYYTHDVQSEDTTLLGIGLLAEAELVADTFEAPSAGNGITETYCVALNIEENEVISFNVYSVWERENDKWKSPQAFGELLKNDALMYSGVIKTNY